MRRLSSPSAHCRPARTLQEETFEVKVTERKKLWVETNEEKLGKMLMEQLSLGLLIYFWVKEGRQRREVCVGSVE